MTMIAGHHSTEGIVVVADSRVTWGPEEHGRFQDTLQKIVPLGEGLVLAFAGDIRAVDRIIKELRGRIEKKGQLKIARTLAAEVPRIAKHFYNIHKSKSAGTSGVSILVAGRETGGKTGLWIFHSPEFTAQPIPEGTVIIGSGRAAGQYLAASMPPVARQDPPAALPTNTAAAHPLTAPGTGSILISHRRPMPPRSAAALILIPALAASAVAGEPGEDLIAGMRRTTNAQKEGHARSQAAIQAAIGEYDQHVAELKANFDRIPANPQDKKWVAAKLRHMAEVDANERMTSVEGPGLNKFNDAEKEEFRRRLGQRAKVIDDSNRADLIKLLRIYPWFKISEFGEQADKDAFYLVQHADADPALQAAVLDILSRMVASNETNRKNYAFLYDRVAISYENPSKRKPQRYGTQGECRAPRTGRSFSPSKSPNASTPGARRWASSRTRNTGG